MQTLDYVSGLHNSLEFSQPSSCLDESVIFLFDRARFKSRERTGRKRLEIGPGEGPGVSVYHSLFFVSIRLRWKIEKANLIATKSMPGGQSTTCCHIVHFIDIIY